MHFRVAVAEYDPFLLLETDVDGKLQMSGPFTDVFELIAEKLNFTYSLHRAKSDSWGIHTNNGWTGMLGMLERNEADLAIGPFTLSYSRFKTFATSVPLYIDHVEILVPVFEWRMSLFNTISAFTYEVWILIFTMALVLSITITVAEKREMRSVEFILKFYKNVWIVSRSLLQECRVNRPPNIPYAILITSWVLGTLVLANVLSGVVLSKLLLRKLRTVDSIYDVIAAKDLYPILEPESSIYYRFQEGTSEMYQSVFKRANIQPEKSILTYKEMATIGMDQVMTGSFVLLTDSYGLKSFLAKRYEDKHPCSFRLARQPLWNLWKVLAFQKSFPNEWILEINKILRYTAESGWLDRRMTLEFLSYEECLSSDAVEVESLGMKHVLGTFVILCIGLVASVIVLIGEILSKREKTVSARSFKKRHRKRISGKRNFIR